MGNKKRKSASQSCGEAAKMTSEVSSSNKRSKTAVSVCTPLLPDDMVSEVLVRLPVKSILRFRAVCRSWAALSSSKNFCNLHMAHSKTVPAPPKLLVVAARANSTGMYSCWPSSPRSYLLFTFDSPRHSSMEVVTPSPCCGLTLVYDAAAPAYYVCNAATRAVRRLPCYPDPRHVSSAGLGFDARSREYKVVRLINGHNNHGKDLNRCDVYTPGADRWRPAAGGVPFSLFQFTTSAVKNALVNKVPPVFANGFLHWLVNSSLITKSPGAAIISFSVADETFGSVRSPPFCTTGVPPRPGCKSQGEHLVELDNQLCMVRNRIRRDSTLEIWNLVDYSPGDWSLNHRIYLRGDVGRYLHDVQVVRVIGSIVSCSSEKKIVIASSKYMVHDQFEKVLHTYEPRRRALETILSVNETHTSAIHSRPGSRFSLFEESLVPVHKSDG